MKNKWRELLYLSLDNALTAAEAKTLTDALATSAELRNEKQHLLQMREQIQRQKTAAFKPFFTARVMHQIENLNKAPRRELVFFESLLSSFRPVIVGAAIVLVGLLTYNMTSNRTFSLSGALGTPEITIQQSIDPTIIFLLE